MLTGDPECEHNRDEGTVVCELDQGERRFDVDDDIPSKQAERMAETKLRSEQMVQQSHGQIRDWWNEQQQADCFTLTRERDGKIDEEFICIERRRGERIKSGAKEVAKTVAPSF